MTTYTTDAQEDTIHVKRADYEAMRDLVYALTRGLYTQRHLWELAARWDVPIQGLHTLDALRILAQHALDLREARDGNS